MTHSTSIVLDRLLTGRVLGAATIENSQQATVLLQGRQRELMSIMATRALPILVVAVMIAASPSASSHGRPPMVWQVSSISAKRLPIVTVVEDSSALGINNLGSIVGWYRLFPGATMHAFKRDLLGATTDIGAAMPNHDTVATDINENSEVVGFRQGTTYSRAFYWSLGEGFKNLSNTNPVGVEDSLWYSAHGINNHGRIVGNASKPSGEFNGYAVTWWYHGAAPSLINPLPEGRANWAWDISDSSWFAGDETNLAKYDRYGYRYRAGTLDYPVDPSPGSNAEHVNAVNEAGTVVGDSWFPCCGTRAVRWRLDGSPLVLGVLPGGQSSTAYDINEQEFVVGSSATSINGAPGWRAFLFHYEFGMVALPLPENFPDTAATSCSAAALNDRKSNGLIQVAGHCTLNGRYTVVRWDVFVDEYPVP